MLIVSKFKLFISMLVLSIHSKCNTTFIFESSQVDQANYTPALRNSIIRGMMPSGFMCIHIKIGKIWLSISSVPIY